MLRLNSAECACGNVTLCDFVVNARFFCLCYLLSARNTVGFSVLYEIRARLVELKRDIAIHALLSEGENPFVIAHSHIPESRESGRSERKRRIGVSMGAATIALWQMGSERKIGSL